MCGRRLGENFLTLLQHWSGAVMCPACLYGGEAAGHNALRGSGPNRKPAFKALPHTQSFSSWVGSGFTSLVALAFNATIVALRYCRAGAVHGIKSRNDALKPRCPLYPQKRTLQGER